MVIGHYPLNAHPARVGLEHLESYFFGWRHISPALGLLQTVGFVGVTLAIALVVGSAATDPLHSCSVNPPPCNDNPQAQPQHNACRAAEVDP